MSVYTAISAVQAELAATGIGKDRRNDQQQYRFRGIDDVLNALAPLLSRNGLVILPRVVARSVHERVNAKGTALFYVVVEAEYDCVSVADPASRHTVRAVGEAMDSGDKATNKAMSAAYKYMALQLFCIPTEGDNDADATTHEVRGRALAPAAAPDEPPFSSDEHARWIAAMVASMRDAAAAKDRALCERLRDQAKSRCTVIGDTDGYAAIVAAMKSTHGAAA